MMNSNQTPIQKMSIFSQLWQDIKKHRFLYYKVLGITCVISTIIAFSIPNYYKCTVMLAPELSSGNKSSNGLASLANSFGVNIGNNNGADAIMPILYPDLMNSVTFKASLFSVKVQKEDDDTTMTYYDYLLNHQRMPWWVSAKKALFSIFNNPSSMGNEKVNPFRLTNEQSGVIGIMNQKVVCDVDNMTMVITIDVTDQDPLIAATMADSVQVHLQEFITEYRTRKAKIDLAYSQKLFKEAKERYEQARKRYASYSDANQRAFLQSVMSQEAALENEMQLQYQSYSRVAAQLQFTEARVQEETPAFTLLQPATVPIKKSGPNRKTIVFVSLLFALVITSIFIIYREGHFKEVLASLRQNSHRNIFDDEELHFISRTLNKNTMNDK